ncbi:hypothetical protein GCM10010430_68100 [Kitasatospora cystarginea]|uniref:Uncharacterized protein n=1 Tax=Kitasatospora cystarginea TaxID=58350 RepID=A0ABP5RVK1_9ACTN
MLRQGVQLGPLRGGPRRGPRIYRGAMGQEPNAELQQFLRSRRAKIAPEGVGLPPHLPLPLASAPEHPGQDAPPAAALARDGGWNGRFRR